MACSVAPPNLGAAGPQASFPWYPMQGAHYLVYRPFFRQKEFLTESRRLLSSRAGKLLSSKLIISPWPRAPDLALFPGGWGGGEQINTITHPVPSDRVVSPPPSPFSPPGWAAWFLSLELKPKLEVEIV